VDGKNCLNLRGVVQAGLDYRGIGRIPMDSIFPALFQLFSTLATTMRINPSFNPLITATQGLQVLAYLAISTQRYKSTYSERIEAALNHISERAGQTIATVFN
jgi:hypothetical protein